MGKVYTDPDLGEVVFRRNRRSRGMSISVHPRRGVTVTLPWHKSYRNGVGFLLTKREWAMETLERQRSMLIDEPEPSPEGIEAMRAEAKKVLPVRLAELARKYSFEYNQVRIKHNVSNWGSCSRKGNINLNLNLMRLPENLRDYVMLHELCHLRQPDHSPRFHDLLESLCPGHRAMEKELRKYRIF